MAGSKGLGVLQRLSNVFNKLVLKRELVGVDESGNKYYRCGYSTPAVLCYRAAVAGCQQCSFRTYIVGASGRRRDDKNLDGYAIERRFVKTPKRDYDPKAGVPPACSLAHAGLGAVLLSVTWHSSLPYASAPFENSCVG